MSGLHGPGNPGAVAGRQLRTLHRQPLGRRCVHPQQPAARYAWGPVADVLTFADQTTGPGGEVMGVEDRLADMLRRHGPAGREHAQRAPAIRDAVHRTVHPPRAAT